MLLDELHLCLEIGQELRSGNFSSGEALSRFLIEAVEPASFGCFPARGRQHLAFSSDSVTDTGRHTPLNGFWQDLLAALALPFALSFRRGGDRYRVD